MKKYLKDYLFLLFVAGSLIALDQITKEIIRTNLAFEEIWSPFPWLTPYARIIHWSNTGAAFGMFSGNNILFAILAVIVSCAIIYYFPRVAREDWWLRLALSLQLAGAVGNLIDRIRQGNVTDFISVGTFPVFNVADSCITIGVIVLLIGVWYKEAQEKKRKAAEAALENEPGVTATESEQRG